MKQTIFRKGNFDAAHRIVNHPGKCANIHGHTYLFEIGLEFDNHVEDVIKEPGGMGYPIDFGVMKTSILKYIDDVYDHGTIFNPKDEYLANIARDWAPKMRSVEMYIYGKDEFCNPSVENIAVQLLMELKHLFDCNQFQIVSIKLNETPNCWTIATVDSLPSDFGKEPKHMEQWKSRNQ